MERGVILCERGQVEQGVHSFVRALEQAAPEEADLERSLRLLLAGWGPLLHPRRAVLELGPQEEDQDLHADGIHFSPDGKTLATVSSKGQLRLWDAATGRPVSRIISLRGESNRVLFSPDSRRLLIGTEGRTFHFYDAGTGRPVAAALRSPGPLLGVAFGPAGDLLAAGKDRKLYRWRPGSDSPGAPVPLPGDWLAFNPSGTLAAVLTRESGVVLVEAAGGKRRGKPLPGKAAWALFSPDGKIILTDSGKGGIRAWEVDTGKALGKPLPAAAALSPDGRTVLGITDETAAQLFNTATGEPLGAPLEHVRQVERVAFGPDGRSVLTTSRGEIFLWDPTGGGQRGRPLLHRNQVSAVAYSPDGRTVASGGLFDARVFLWDVDAAHSFSAPLPHPGGVDRLAVSRDGRQLLTACSSSPRPEVRIRTDGGGPRIPGIRSSLHPSTEVRLWDLATGRQVAGPLREGQVERLTEDGLHCLTRARGGGLQLWDVRQGQRVGRPWKLSGGGKELVLSPDNSRAAEVVKPASGRGKQSVRLWDMATGRLVGKALEHPGTIEAVAFSPDGRTILTGGGWANPALLPLENWDGSEDYLKRIRRGEEELRKRGEVLRRGEVRFWDAATGQPRGAVLNQKNGVQAVAFSPDGAIALLRSGAEWWCLDVARGTVFADALHRRGQVQALSPDAKHVLLTRKGQEARLWELRKGQAAGPPLRDPGPLDVVAFSPDGRLLLLVNHTERARFWDPFTGLPVGPFLPHEQVNAIAFSRDGRSCFTAGEDGRVCRWRVPAPMVGPLERIRLWAQVHTAMETDDSGAAESLTWQRLEELWQKLQREPPR
jgi:WD40 repeat protein